VSCVRERDDFFRLKHINLCARGGGDLWKSLEDILKEYRFAAQKNQPKFTTASQITTTIHHYTASTVSTMDVVA
jgi:hypothetical protein